MYQINISLMDDEVLEAYCMLRPIFKYISSVVTSPGQNAGGSN